MGIAKSRGRGTARTTTDSEHQPGPAPVPPAAMEVAGHRRADTENTACVWSHPRLFTIVLHSLCRHRRSSHARQPLHKPSCTRVCTCGTPSFGCKYRYRWASVLPICHSTPLLPLLSRTGTTHNGARLEYRTTDLLHDPGDQGALPQRPRPRILTEHSGPVGPRARKGKEGDDWMGRGSSTTVADLGPPKRSRGRIRARTWIQLQQ